MKGMNIMKKTRLFSKIAAMALVVVMVCCVGASAYGAASQTMTIQGRDGKTYIGYTELYDDSSTNFRGSAWVETRDHSTVPSTSLGCRAGLAYGDSGEIFYEGGWSFKNSDGNSHHVVTPQQYSRYCVFSVGWAIVGASDIKRLPDSPMRGNSIYRSADAEVVLSALAEATLTEDDTYPVNDAGETYGSVLLADMVGEDPDLLAAVNQDGVSGYIRNDDILRTDKTVAEGADNSIPLYDANGNVIGSFEIGEYEDVAIDTPAFETARANVEHLFGR